MRKLNYIIATFLCVALFGGCIESTIKKNLSHEDYIEKTYPVIDKIENNSANGFLDVRLYIIDSCEYIGSVDGSYNDFLSHKGNCKFCIQRNKN